MKFIQVVGILMAFAMGAANAIAAERDSPPQCGLDCIVSVTAKSTSSSCGLTDQDCICADANLQNDITACVKKSCSLIDQLATKKYSMDSCGVEPVNRQRVVWMVPIIAGSVALGFFAVRVLEKGILNSHRWWWDDTVMCVAVVFWIALMFLGIPISRAGLGRDIWDNSPDDVTQVLYLYYWDEVVYFPQIALTKISILFFYLRIFERGSIGLRPTIMALIAVNIGYAIAFTCVSIFQCTPVQGAWLTWDGEHHANCRNINAQGWSGAAINIALDLATIILPMYELSSLSLSKSKKIQLFFMFSLGFFVTVVSILRLRSLLLFGDSENMTQDYVDLGVWTTIECPVGIICACLPATRSFLTRFFPVILGQTRNGQSGRSTNRLCPGGSGNYLRQTEEAEMESTSQYTMTQKGAPEDDPMIRVSRNYFNRTAPLTPIPGTPMSMRSPTPVHHVQAGGVNWTDMNGRPLGSSRQGVASLGLTLNMTLCDQQGNALTKACIEL